jgi:transposase-like protein
MKGAQCPPMKKRLQCFKNKKHNPEKQKGLNLLRKRGFQHFKRIRNALKKNAQASNEKRGFDAMQITLKSNRDSTSDEKRDFQHYKNKKHL